MKFETKAPTVTIKNTTGPEWQVTVEGLIGEYGAPEIIDFTVLVKRTEAPATELLQLATKRAIALLQAALETVERQPGVDG